MVTSRGVFFQSNDDNEQMDVGQNGRPKIRPQMWMSSLVLTIQLLGYLILTHTQMSSLGVIMTFLFRHFSGATSWNFIWMTHTHMIIWKLDVQAGPWFSKEDGSSWPCKKKSVQRLTRYCLWGHIFKWLVVSNMAFIFHFIHGIYNPSHWRSPSFFRGVGLNHQPDIIINHH